MSEQDWSNGKIGTLGCSSTAEWQMAVAAMNHPAHAAMVPQGYGAGVGRIGDFYEQGKSSKDFNRDVISYSFFIFSSNGCG
jgi:hypothetical protein